MFASNSINLYWEVAFKIYRIQGMRLSIKNYAGVSRWDVSRSDVCAKKEMNTGIIPQHSLFFHE